MMGAIAGDMMVRSYYNHGDLIEAECSNCKRVDAVTPGWTKHTDYVDRG